jgi:hypothetical protein
MSICRIEEPNEVDEEAPSCDVVNNCHRFANCEFDQSTYRYECVCGPGYDGSGIDCIETEASCAQEDICDIHANCIYNSTLRKSVCVCQEGYEGSGKSCQPISECKQDSECGYHSNCNQGVCECNQGYERDNTDLCVPVGSCNGVYCAENAYCRFDSQRKINFCYCPDGYSGDGVNECKSTPPPCNIRNNCGLYASCVPNYLTSNYECTCHDGYIGDGFVCVLDQNCNNNPHFCDVNAECLPTASGYKCICNQGKLRIVLKMFRNIQKFLKLIIPTKNPVKDCEPCPKKPLRWRLFGIFNKTLFAACLIHYAFMHDAFGTLEQSQLFVEDIQHHIENVLPFHFKFSRETIAEKKLGQENKFKNYKKYVPNSTESINSEE